MTYPKQVVLIIHHSEDERQIKRIIFQTMEDHMEYIKNLPANQQLIEEEDKALDLALSWDNDNEPLSASQLLHEVFSDIGQAYKDFAPKN
tara:strand:+ start:100 stop:369 length:270 start_codon:yes stop_codon:yes gene_type:complete